MLLNWLALLIAMKVRRSFDMLLRLYHRIYQRFFFWLIISKLFPTNLLLAILLLNSVIRVFNDKMESKTENVKEELSAPQVNNVKLHLEQITPVLCSLFDLKYLSEINTVAEDEVDKLDEILNTYCAVLITLSTIAEKDDWIEIICKQVS